MRLEYRWKSFERFKRRMSYSGKSIKEEQVNNAKKYLEATFEHSASHTDGVYFWEHGCKVLEDYEDKQPLNIRLFGEKFSTANGGTISFQTLIDTEICVGDIIYTSLRNEFWICTDSKCIANIHYEGTFTKCNWFLKWQDKKTGEILEYPCQNINSTQYNSGEQSNITFTIGSSQHLVTLPADEYTIRINDKVRVYLSRNKEEPIVYRATQNDTTSYNYGKKGIVKVTFYEEPRNSEKDRIDLGICDYIENVEEENTQGTTSEEVRSQIKHTSTTLKCGGSAKTYIAEYYKGSEIVEDIKSKWTISCEFLDKLEITEKDNSISIKVKNDKTLIGQMILLELSDIEDKYKTSITLTIASLL